MSVTKEDLLLLANELLQRATEVHCRAAVSRAYYAAFHGCVAWHAGMSVPGSNTGNGGVHVQFISRLRNGAPEWSASHRILGRVIAAQLSALKLQRKIADYDLDEPFDNALAMSNCALAAQILNKLLG